MYYSIYKNQHEIQRYKTEYLEENKWGYHYALRVEKILSKIKNELTFEDELDKFDYTNINNFSSSKKNHSFLKAINYIYSCKIQLYRNMQYNEKMIYIQRYQL